MTHWSDNEWSEESLFSAERALAVIKQHFAIDARHRIGAKRGQTVHHINGDVFDNRSENLRVVNKETNRCK